MRVLALDPGDKVGYAAADVFDDGHWENLTHGITPLRDMAIKVHEVAAEYDLIVFEDWRLYPIQAKTMIGSTFPSVQFIGMVKLSAWLSGTKLAVQGAKVKTAADAVMAKLNPELYELVTRPVRHDDGHDQDALRHLFYWCWRNTSLGKPGTIEEVGNDGEQAAAA